MILTIKRLIYEWHGTTQGTHLSSPVQLDESKDSQIPRLGGLGLGKEHRM